MNPIIDTHTHLLSPDPFPARRREHLLPAWGRPERNFGIEDLTQDLDQSCVHRALLVQAVSVYGYNNEYLYEAAATSPGRYKVVPSIDILAPDAKYTAQGLLDLPATAAIRLFHVGGNINASRYRLDDPACLPLYGVLETANVPLMVQTTISHLPALREVMAHYPGLSVVLDHGAMPDFNRTQDLATLIDLAEVPQIYLKVTSKTLFDAERSRPDGATIALKALIQSFGANRLMWGSNYPASIGSLADLVALAHRIARRLSPSDRSSFFQLTADELLW